MPNELASSEYSEFLSFLAQETARGAAFLPSLNKLSEAHGVSVSSLREELQVARRMGFVDVKPRTGIRILPYSFKPAVLTSLKFAVNIDSTNFRQYSDLRNHIEASYWYQAVSHLQQEDIEELEDVIKLANKKLNSDPIHVPHDEHRLLHLTIFKRLDNLFVKGILEAYWDIYEAVGLSVYEDRKYLERVWLYHKQMVEAISNGDFLNGYQALVAHMDLLFQREQENSKNYFE